MPTSAKLPEIRKEAFTKARESLGLSVKELAGMACLSVRQIEQIENGGSTSFYSAQIRVTAAKKVAGLLKLPEEEAFDFGGLFPPQTGAAEIQAEPVIEKVAETIKPDLQPQQVKVLNPQEFVVESGFNKEKTSENSKKKLFLLLSIAAAGVFALINLRPLFFPEPVKKEVVLVEEVVAEPVSPNTPITPDVAQDNKPGAPVAGAAAFAVATPSIAASTALTSSSECPSADASIVSYKSEAPKKTGDMVYVQAKTSQTVCVVDATGKTQNKTLESGMGASIYGKPPFKVLTAGLNQVDLYYQGAKVRPSNASGKTIILEAAELGQPAPATDTQPTQ